MFWAVPGVRWGLWGWVTAAPPAPARDLLWAVPGRATESFSWTESSTCSHFLEELVQCKAEAASRPLAEAECWQSRAQDSGVIIVITVIFYTDLLEADGI